MRLFALRLSVSSVVKQWGHGAREHKNSTIRRLIVGVGWELSCGACEIWLRVGSNRLRVGASGSEAAPTSRGWSVMACVADAEDA